MGLVLFSAKPIFFSKKISKIEFRYKIGNNDYVQKSY